jgi:hypothetical protein
MGAMRALDGVLAMITARRAWPVAVLVLALIGAALFLFHLTEAEAHALGDALVYALPGLVAMEFVGIALDVLSARSITRDRAFSFSFWVRITLTAYVLAALLPAGRMVGEASRAAALSPRMGRMQSALALTSLHALHVFTAALVCLGCGLIVQHRTLAAASYASALFMLGIAATLHFTPHLIASRFGASARAGAAPERVRITRIAFLSQLALRLLTLARGALLLASTHTQITLPSLGAIGSVQFISANAGDAIPGQAGATEGTFALFADALGTHATGALTLALVMRAARIVSVLLAASLSLILAKQTDADPSDAEATPQGHCQPEP